MDGSAEEVVKVISVLNSGLELESNGLKFFSRAAQKVKDPKGRQTLRYLANEEKAHLKFIRDLKASLEKMDVARVITIVKSHRSSMDLKVFPELEDFLETVKETRGDDRILEEAEEIETRSIRFYEESLKGTVNKDYQEIFKALIKEEEGHLKLVQQMSDYMKLHGVWSGLEEYFVNE
jgi:rubrerythrin